MASVFMRSPTREYPIAVRGEGIYLWDTAGKRYLDGSSGALVANIGHGREEVARVAFEQARTMQYVHGSHFSNEPLIRFSQRVAALAPGNPTDWFFFPTSGGSEATESAIKLARQYHVERGEDDRYRTVSRWTSYHGASLGALAASGLAQRRAIYEPLLNLDAFPKIPKPDPRRDGRDDARQLQDALHRLGPETVSAFIAEPVIGAADAALAPGDGYYEEIRRTCSEHGVLFIADEVMCGVGRAGRTFAITYWDAVPDIIIVGKGVAAGYAPLAGLLVSRHVHDTIRYGSGSFKHGYTYAGHPLTLAIGEKVLEIVEREQLIQRSADLGQRLLRGLHDLAERHPMMLDVRGRGLMAGFTLGDPQTGQPWQEPGAADRLGRIAFAHGLVIYPGSGAFDGTRGDHVLIGPPLTIEPDELDEMLQLLDAALAELSATTGAQPTSAR